MEFRALGSFEVLAGDRLVTPSAPKLRQALALLVLDHDKIVNTHNLVDELWGDAPPRHATPTVQTYIYEIRRGLRPYCEPDRLLVTKPTGYLARVAPEATDIHVAEALVQDAGNALAREDPDTARRILVEALALWRGDPLSNVTCGPLLAAHATRLRESWLHALEMRIDVDLQLNRHHELVGELKALSAGNPYHEDIHGKLMLALYRCGRRNEALEVYRRLHRGFADELGLGPGPQIQRLQQLMLVADPTLEPPSVRRSASIPAPPVPPAQLPPDIADFVGRDELIGQVRAVLDAPAGGAAVPVVSITGMPGVGKTTTAVHIAHAVRAGYPDGQLFVSLGGASGNPVPVLAALLRSVGIGSALLEDVHEHVAAFRTWAAERRVLLVFDDADSAAQIAPLLPAGGGCAVILTNRRPLYGLPSVTPVRLGVLTVGEGVELLARIIGPTRVAREPDAAAAIVRVVGGLPLAVRLLGQRLAGVHAQRLERFVDGLTSAGARYHRSDLAYVGKDMSTRLATSYDKLDEHDRSAFRLLAVLRDGDFSAVDAAEVFRDDVLAADMTLLRLADASLIQVVAEAPAGWRRYGLHEMVRPYTLECVAAEPRPPVEDGPVPRTYQGRRPVAARSRYRSDTDPTHPRARRPLS